MDLRTLVLAVFMVELCCAVALLLMSHSVGGMKGLRWFGWAYGAVAAAVVLLVLSRGPGLPALYFARLLFLLSAVLLAQGLTKYTAPQASLLGWSSAWVVLYAAAEFSSSAHPGAALRVFAVAFCAQLLVCVFLLLANREAGERSASRTVAGLVAGMLLLVAAHAVLAPLLGVPMNLEAIAHPGKFLIAGSFAFMILDAGTAFGLVWMMTARLRNQLEQQARTDVLTGLLNRRALELNAQRELAASRREHTPLAVLAMDLDHFKSLNDTYGHAAGDYALAAAARLLSQCLRNSDHLARLGGEEFVAILPARDAERAAIVAERLRSRLQQLRVDYDGHALALTVSIGIATAGPGDNWPGLLQRADVALYEAKRAGRNCIRAAAPAQPQPGNITPGIASASA